MIVERITRMMETEIQPKNEIATTKQCLRPRPLWQRIIYPIIGGILIILGVAGWIMPVIPGFPLIIIGIPLAACFNARFELSIRRQMHAIGHAIMMKIKHQK